MARVNVYLPDRLADAVRAGGVNLSSVTQVAAERELVRRSTSSWLRRVALQRRPGVTHEMIVEATSPGRPPAPPSSGDPIGVAGSGPGSGSWPTDRAHRHVVLHPSAALDLMVASDLGLVVEAAVEGCALHAPAHFDGAVLAVLGRLDEAGVLGDRASDCVETLATAPIERHPLPPLLAGSWHRRDALDPDRAMYLELALGLRARLVTTDVGFGPSIVATVAGFCPGTGGGRGGP
jgi:predicted nucleic acid-binding protein